MNGIEEHANVLEITDNRTQQSMIQTAPDDTDKENNTLVFARQTSTKQKEKQFRRISLPPDAYRKSKFASWVHDNLPSSPCRNNSHGSRASVKSSSSDPTSASLPTPTTSPTSTDTPQLPTPTATESIPLPPRTTSLQSSALSVSTKAHEEQGETTFPSMPTPDQEKKKKRFLPLVSRIRLGPGDRSSKKTVSINPPEPPPQLLLSALHCSDQDVMERYSTAGSPYYSDSQSETTSSPSITPMASISESPTSFYWAEKEGMGLSFTNEENNSNNDNESHNLSTAMDPSLKVRRRSSCPLMSLRHSTTPQESVMMQSFCSSIPASINTTTANMTNHHHHHPSSPPSLTVAQDVYDDEQQCVLSFSAIKPRSQPLRRRTSGKREKRALRAWHDTLVASLKAEQDDGTSSHRSLSTLTMDQLANEKRERYALTRKFILREFYLTEVTFWNQLYYSKVMFLDPLQLSLARHSTFTRPSDLDIFSNLPDLMQCSSQLIRSMAPFLDHPPSAKMASTSTPTTPSASYQDLSSITLTSSSSSNTTNSMSTTPSTIFDDHHHSTSHEHPHHQRRPLSHHDSFTTTISSSIPPSPTSSTSSSSTANMLPIHLHADTQSLPSPNDQLLLGKEICAMASQFVVFLRWALDYKVNRKKLDHRSQHNKGFASYQEKLSLRKETNQFHVHDYLIIPIQRITRYGLLLADLQKHTEKEHPDYHYISRARMILTSLAVAMNKAQHK
ncbi:hypothetical protein BCR42DRAFT_418382 [Absidia repens]|uniref:DH domain-containing protein n=1 Tax=Absidia repens TaxID=90262 RepID=A0A1X2IBK0_9FUNG|nr:hypothetical protein BCR42DRAFT_418382 [Absidia repens]